MSNRRSFLERLTGVVEKDDEHYDEDYGHEDFGDDSVGLYQESQDEFSHPSVQSDESGGWMDEAASEDEGELMVDVYQTDRDIIIQTMVAGVSAQDLDLSISKEIVTIKGRREEPASVDGDDYFHRELYWGPFSRTILLPQEIEADSVEAVEKNGLLTIRLPKIDKERTKQVRVKSM